jgi:hypothetical protein
VNLSRHRLQLFIAVSVALHSLILWGPGWHMPEPEPDLPPLMAKLEPMAVPQPPPPKPKARKKPRPKPRKVEAAAPVPQPDALASEPVVENDGIESVPEEAAAPAPVSGVNKDAPALPRQAVLRFTVTVGSAGFIAGEAKHRLEIREGHYSLRAESGTVGLASLIKSANMVQVSRGLATDHNLRPERFEEERQVGGKMQKSGATFAWDAGKLSFDQGGKELDLPTDAQDILSVFYQLSQLKLNGEEVEVRVSNGRKLETYRLEIGQQEEIYTKLGKLLTLPVRKIHGPNEEGLEIWLGLEYRLLPVKVRQLDRDGSVAGEMIIKEIRVSDDPPQD